MVCLECVSCQCGEARTCASSFTAPSSNALVVIVFSSVFICCICLLLSADIFDSAEVWTRCFAVDWQYLLDTPVFVKQMASLRLDLNTLRDVLSQRFALLFPVFLYYSCVSPGDSVGSIKVRQCL